MGKALIVCKVDPPPAFLRDVREALGVTDVEVIRVEGNVCDVVKSVRSAEGVVGVAVFLVGVPSTVLSKLAEFCRRAGKPLLSGVAVRVEDAFCGVVPKDRRVVVGDSCLEYYALAEGLVMLALPKRYIKEYYGRKFPEYVRRR